ncbi:SPOSA6832_02185 [Sporobolomyces salmonicolor]|uniref:EKC/KEOPS complex subunit CGI121 n=1 Tax=Sporidiobolus salmonicolor TaxID=5005 RepID=A0A0D6ELN9_SPOSA|nr:SPOSA6832_02185 [Sporobolomyces salmonicolor]
METYPLDHTGTIVHLALFTGIKNAAALRQRLVHASTLPDDDNGTAERAAVDFAFIDAAMITSRLHVLTAIHQALLARSQGVLKTKTLHSEVIWMLEPGTNVRCSSTRPKAKPDDLASLVLSTQISDSLKHFGLSTSTSSLLLVRIVPSDPSASSGMPGGDEVLRRMHDVIEGKLASLELLGRLPEGGTNEKSIRKVRFFVWERPSRDALNSHREQTYKLNQDAVFSSLKQGSPEALQALDRLVISTVALKSVM